MRREVRPGEPACRFQSMHQCYGSRAFTVRADDLNGFEAAVRVAEQSEEGLDALEAAARAGATTGEHEAFDEQLSGDADATRPSSSRTIVALRTRRRWSLAEARATR